MRTILIYSSLLFFCIASYCQSINLERGLIAYYPFNENANDQTSFANHGTVHGAELRGDARCGDGAYYFDGDMNYIDFGSSEMFQNNFRGLTISLMFQYTDETVEDFMTIFGKWAFNVERDQFALFLSVQKKLSFAIADGKDFGYGVYSNTNFEPYKWYHIIAVWNRSRKVGIFVNGEMDKMGEQHGNGLNSNSHISLKAGRQIVGENRPFTGLIDEIRIYNRSLSIPEIRTLYRIDNMVCNQFTLKGNVYNKATNEPIEGRIIFEELDTGEEFINVKSDSATGYYEIVLPIGYKYAFYAKAKGFISINNSVSTEGIKHNSVIERDLFLIPIAVGSTVLLNNIFFETAKAVLKDESLAELKRLLALFDQVPGLVIEIGGHTDSVGADDYNMNLSDARANAVRDYLLENGISEEQITAKGYGETIPVASNDTEDGRQENRRVEFKILAFDDIE